MSTNLNIIGDCSEDIFYCTICKYPLITSKDFVSGAEFKSCNDCFLTFIESDISGWKNGKRPEKKKVNDYLLTKKKLNERKVKL